MLSFDGSESVWGVDDFSDDDSCYSHPEGSGDVAERAVDLRLRRTPFVLHQLLVTGSVVDGSLCASLAAEQFGLGAEAASGAAGFVHAQVLHRLLLAVYALELAAGEGLVLLEFLAQGPCQGVALYLPELSLPDHEGVAAQGCTHG